MFQATRRVLAPVRSSIKSRMFTSLIPRDIKQETWTPAGTYSRKQILEEQAIENKEAQDHYFQSNTSVESKIPIEKTTMPMAAIDTLTDLPNNLSITFSTVADLEKYVQLCKSEGNRSPDEMLDLFQHFVSGVDGRHASLDVATWTFNYGENAAAAEVAKKVTVGAAAKQAAMKVKVGAPGGEMHRKQYAEKLFSAIGGNFGVE